MKKAITREDFEELSKSFVAPIYDEHSRFRRSQVNKILKEYMETHYPQLVFHPNCKVSS